MNSNTNIQHKGGKKQNDNRKIETTEQIKFEFSTHTWYIGTLHILWLQNSCGLITG